MCKNRSESIDVQYDKVSLNVTNSENKFMERIKRYKQQSAKAGTFIACKMFKFELPHVSN